MGILPRWSIRTLASTLSTQITSLPLSAKQAPATSPTYPVPTTAIFNPAPATGFALCTKQQRLSSHGATGDKCELIGENRGRLPPRPACAHGGWRVHAS